MGRKQSRTHDDILAYGRQYYEQTKEERQHEYALVAKRSYYRNKLKAETDDAKIAKYQTIIDETQNELDNIRAQRWERKRANGGAKYKKDVINEVPIAIQ